MFLRRVGTFRSTVLNKRNASTRPKLKTDRFIYPEGMTAYEEDYTENPEYPEIDKETRQMNEFQRKKRQSLLDWHDKIKQQPNPEAKTLELNMPRYIY